MNKGPIVSIVGTFSKSQVLTHHFSKSAEEIHRLPLVPCLGASMKRRPGATKVLPALEQKYASL